MVDTRDLKSLGQKCPCGFDSRLRHKWDGVSRPICGLPLSPNLDYFTISHAFEHYRSVR